MISATNISAPPNEDRKWAIVVDSIGTAGAGLVKALKKVTPLSENSIATLLYQAPSKLISDLPKGLAEEMNELLASTGLECRVVEKDAVMESGDASHEVALVIRDVSRMNEIAQLIFELIGARIQEVRQILSATPTVLIGKISKNTAYAIRERFRPLDVEVDISNPDEAGFDVFLGDCSELDRNRIARIFRDLNTPLLGETTKPKANSIIAVGLSREQSDKIWQRVSRTSLPVRLINRDFERFDLQLDALPDSEDAIRYLTTSTGMPDNMAHKALQNLPIIVQQNIPFMDLDRHMARIVELGGQATGHLLVFQTFSLQIETIKDAQQSAELLQHLGQVPEQAIKNRLTAGYVIEGPFTSLQAKWLQYELKKAGTVTRKILR